jgi:hypothetical protein
MRDRWVGYDEFATYPGHCQAIEYDKSMMRGFIGEGNANHDSKLISTYQPTRHWVSY